MLSFPAVSVSGQANADVVRVVWSPFVAVVALHISKWRRWCLFGWAGRARGGHFETPFRGVLLRILLLISFSICGLGTLMNVGWRDGQVGELALVKVFG